MAANHEAPAAPGQENKGWMAAITEPAILFPMLGVALVAVIGYGTYSLVRTAYDGSRLLAASSALDTAQTYEAQVLRALREIDQALKVVEYAYESGASSSPLAELGRRHLLPSELLFVVSVTDENGTVVDSTRPLEGRSVAGRQYFEGLRDSADLGIGQSRRDPESGEWMLSFGRRLDGPDGRFVGIVIISVDPMYFVSGYESRFMGDKGVLGILGTDGVFRIRRTGDSVFHGEQVDYPTTVAESGEAEPLARLQVDPWDGERRYTVVRELFGFPLAIVSGLSEREQLAPARAQRGVYLVQATVGGILGLIVIGVLGRLSRQLQRSRQLAVEEQTAHSRQVEHLAFHDTLTGLPNRSFFNRLLSRSVLEAARYDRNLAVMFLDLDGFKTINDTLGHQAGDELLRQVSHRLTEMLRDSDTVARLGGDEFVVLLPAIGGTADLAAVAGKVLQSIGRPFVLSGKEYRVSASVGISIFPRDGTDAESLMKNADVAMYSAKARGKDGFEFYSHELNENTLERLASEMELRRALAQNEFRIWYQVRRRMKDGAITGVEALLRWEHPEKGIVAPGEFLPLANATGLIVPIGRWVMETACRQCVEWRTHGLHSLAMAVNVSSREFFDPGFVRGVGESVKRTGIDPGALEIEVAEHTLLGDLGNAVRVISELKALGVGISVDDFGIGYSSLSALRESRIDTIKIDSRLVRSTGESDAHRKLLEGVAAIARALGPAVVAKGVQSGTEAALLDRELFDEAQGINYGEPLPADRVFELLRPRDSTAPPTQLPTATVDRR